jgi:molecular chaperone DnaJ
MAAQREWFEKNYYKILGVAEDATAKDITKAYRKLARDSHPDTHPGDDAAEERFKEVSTAYDVLGDDTKRKEYDEVRRLGPQAGGFGGGSAPGGFNFNVAGDGLGDLLGGLFGRGGGSGRRGGAAATQRGADVEAQLTLSFLDAARGLTTTLHLTADAPCSTCNGSGAKPGTQPRVCSQCGGRGVIDDNQGFFSFQSPCRVCGGSGSVIEFPCATCRGSGVEHRPREVQARIPAGVADGQKIRLRGRGSPGRHGGPSGDLIVECRVMPHPLFGRDGSNLTLRLPITFPEAALGGSVDVPTLDGPRVTLRLKPGTASGSRHRVKGKGIATAKHMGDLIVTVEVQVPHHLSADQRTAVEALAAATTVSPRSDMTKHETPHETRENDMEG